MRGRTLIVFSAAAALVLSGCGKRPDTGQGGATEVGSLKILADKVGAISAEKSTAHLVFKAEFAGQGITAEGDVRFTPEPAMRMTMEMPPQGTMEMRLIDDVFYVKAPGAGTSAKPWFKIDTTGNDPMSKALGAAVKQMKENSDPAQTLKQLAAVGEITGQRQEELNGKQATHYTATVDLNKVSSDHPDMSDMLKEARKAGLDTFPLDVWVDQDGLPVRILMAMDMQSPQTQNQQVNVKITVEYSNWGAPVELTAPPPAEVGEVPGR